MIRKRDEEYFANIIVEEVLATLREDLKNAGQADLEESETEVSEEDDE